MSDSLNTPNASDDRLDVLLGRIQVLEDERMIRETLSRYCQGLDYGLVDQVVDCFTEDCVWTWTVRGDEIRRALQVQGMGQVPIGTQETPHALHDLPAPSARGRDAVRAMFMNHTKPPERWHKHCVVDTIVRLDGDAATVASYFVRVDASTLSTGAYIRAFGRYLDQVVRGDDGGWRIKWRHAEIEAHYDEIVLANGLDAAQPADAGQ